MELAQLNHLSTRLVRGWTHLERQKGGIGLRGPGETQLETDRLLLQVRVMQLKSKIEKVRQTRAQVEPVAKNQMYQRYRLLVIPMLVNPHYSTVWSMKTFTRLTNYLPRSIQRYAA